MMKLIRETQVIKVLLKVSNTVYATGVLKVTTQLFSVFILGVIRGNFRPTLFGSVYLEIL